MSFRPTSQISNRSVSNQENEDSARDRSSDNYRPCAGSRTEVQQPITNPKKSDRQCVEEHYTDGSYYNGEKLNGLRHGKGNFYYNDGGFYKGQWRFGKMNGFGTLFYPSNKKAYEGQWIDDKFFGKGTIYNESVELMGDDFDFANFNKLGECWLKYEGEFKDDYKVGPLLLLAALISC